ncbi:hypothetical protein [Enterocloster clostridioformis]|uniref:Carbohydrate ABC transporter permease n=1 Tax=Enterocloster clostridioformis TaxID=1531 RepID=A0A1I0JE86_9FIRM|nr:hypothetical protein [Enterocloster clostridioformis]SEU08272.1 hypothetical protein SAMN05216521_105527 [Enterocloster clostridioformis]SEW45287.1 hypothetical protein SAMN05216528_105316 [Enterocloster clostridioformis]
MGLAGTKCRNSQRIVGETIAHLDWLMIRGYVYFEKQDDWFGKYSYSLMFLNSAKVTLLSVVFAVTTSILAGYGFSKLKFPRRDKIFLLYLATMMIPHQLLMVPKMLMFKELGIYNTHWALILPAAFIFTF